MFNIIGSSPLKESTIMEWSITRSDYTGVPILVDLAAMREYYKENKLNADDVNPATKSDLVIDHSIIVYSFRGEEPIILNMKDEFERNVERYDFLKWSQQSFKNVRIIPPGHGIVHQINLEYLSSVAVIEKGVAHKILHKTLFRISNNNI